MSDDSVVLIKWKYINELQNAKIAIVSLNRTSSANAFNAEVIEELTNVFKHIEAQSDCRMMILKGEGKHFSAGADLKWMQDSVNLSYSENCEEAKKLAAMFQTLYDLSIPTLAVVQGAVYGGAVGLTACCDFAIGLSNCKFCLSEVKLGILPAVIMPFLGRKMKVGSLLRYSYTAKVFNSEEALECGLIDICCEQDEIEAVVNKEINALLQGGPEALKSLKKLQRFLAINNYESCDETVEAIAKARQSKEASHGFHSFFSKSIPNWVGKIPEEKNFL